MRLKGLAEVILARRKKAFERFKNDLSLNEIARRIECNASSVMRWWDRWNAHGEEGLRVLTSLGSPPRLTHRQKDQLLRYLLMGQLEFGWKTDIWTT